MKQRRQKRSKNSPKPRAPKPGKFWPPVRAAIWEKAQQLYQEEQAATMKSDFSGITATRHELVEGGYFYRAKIIVLRNLYYASKGLSSLKERIMIEKYGEQCI